MQESSTGEYIAEDAPHWRPEPYIPLDPVELAAHLQRQGKLSSGAERAFRRTTARLLHQIDRRQRASRLRLARQYRPLDPDRDMRELQPLDAASRSRRAAVVTDGVRRLLRQAGYTELSREEIQACIGLASDWGVRLHVDLDEFEQLSLFARGDIYGVRIRRHWKNLWRPEEVEVAIYQRLAILFRVRPGRHVEEIPDDGQLYLRLFKNIPKLDVDMLLPGTRIRMSWFDRTRILVPSIGGVGMTLFKILRGALIVAFVGLYGTLALVALILAAISYAGRSVFSYVQTKDKYLLNMTRSLYYQKLDTGTGVIMRLSTAAVRQEAAEAILILYALATADRPLSHRMLRRRCERLLRELLDVEVLARLEPGLSWLATLELIAVDPDGRVRCTLPGATPTLAPRGAGQGGALDA